MNEVDSIRETIIRRYGSEGFAVDVFRSRRCVRMSENGCVGPTYTLGKVVFSLIC